MKYRTSSEKTAERNRIRKSEEIRSYFDSKPEKRDPKAYKRFKAASTITAVGNYASTEIKQRCVIRVVGSGIPASRVSTERRSNARSKSERAVDPDERVP